MTPRLASLAMLAAAAAPFPFASVRSDWPGCGSRPSAPASWNAAAAPDRSPWIRSTSPRSYRASPAAGVAPSAAYRVRASASSSSASGSAPWDRMICARCTAHWPVNGTISGCIRHHWVRAVVQSAIRR